MTIPLFHFFIQDFDIALVDWNLGMVTADQSIDFLAKRGVRVIIITGDADAVPRQDCTILGKPFGIDDLKASIDES